MHLKCKYKNKKKEKIAFIRKYLCLYCHKQLLLLRDCNIFYSSFKNRFRRAISFGSKCIFILLLLLIIPTQNSAQKEKDSITIQKSSLEDAVNYNASDSIVMDMTNQKAYLYQNAHVDYGEIVLDACFIRFDFNTFIIPPGLFLMERGTRFELAAFCLASRCSTN